MAELATDRLGRSLPLRYGSVIGSTLQGTAADTGWYRVFPDGIMGTRPESTVHNIEIANLRADVVGMNLSGWRIIAGAGDSHEVHEILSVTSGIIKTYRVIGNDVPASDIRFVLVPELVNPLQIFFDEDSEGTLELSYSTDFLLPGFSGYSREVLSGAVATPTLITFATLTPGQGASIPATILENLFYRFTTPSANNEFNWGEHIVVGAAGGGGAAYLRVNGLPPADSARDGIIYIDENDNSSMWYRGRLQIAAAAASFTLVEYMGRGGAFAWQGSAITDPDVAVAADYYNSVNGQLRTKPAGALEDAVTNTILVTSGVATGTTWLGVAATPPTSADQAAYFDSSNNQFYQKTAGNDPSTITTSTFAPQGVTTQIGDWLGAFENDAAATANLNYDVSHRQSYYQIQFNNFRQHSPGSATWFTVSSNVIFGAGGWRLFNPDTVDTEAEAVAQIDSEGYSSGSNYVFYHAADDELKDIDSYTIGDLWVLTEFYAVMGRTVPNTVWLGARFGNPGSSEVDTLAEVLAWFQANSYDSNLVYGFHNTVSGEIETVTFTAGVDWVDISLVDYTTYADAVLFPVNIDTEAELEAYLDNDIVYDAASDHYWFYRASDTTLYQMTGYTAAVPASEQPLMIELGGGGGGGGTGLSQLQVDARITTLVQSWARSATALIPEDRLDLTALAWRGQYNELVNYGQGDVVWEVTNIYMSRVDNNLGQDPITSTSAWFRINVPSIISVAESRTPGSSEGRLISGEMLVGAIRALSLTQSQVVEVADQVALDNVTTANRVSFAIVTAIFGSYQVNDILFYSTVNSVWVRFPRSSGSGTADGVVTNAELGANNVLTLTLSVGDPVTVDLSGLIAASGADGVVTNAELGANNVLTLTLSVGDPVTVDLSGLGSLTSEFIVPDNVGGSGDSTTLSTGRAIPSYPEGFEWRYVTEADALTTNPVLSVDGNAAIVMRRSDGSVIPIGSLLGGRLTRATYDRNRFLLDIDPPMLDGVVTNAELGDNNVLTLTLSVGGPITVDLSSLVSASGADGVITGVTLNGTVVTITRSVGDDLTLNLADLVHEASYPHSFDRVLDTVPPRTATNEINLTLSSGDLYDLVISEHTDMPTDFLLNVILHIPIKLVSGETVWRGFVRENNGVDETTTSLRLDLPDRTGVFSDRDTIAISFGTASSNAAIVTKLDRYLGNIPDDLSDAQKDTFHERAGTDERIKNRVPFTQSVQLRNVNAISGTSGNRWFTAANLQGDWQILLYHNTDFLNYVRTLRPGDMVQARRLDGSGVRTFTLTANPGAIANGQVTLTGDWDVEPPNPSNNSQYMLSFTRSAAVIGNDGRLNNLELDSDGRTLRAGMSIGDDITADLSPLAGIDYSSSVLLDYVATESELTTGTTEKFTFVTLLSDQFIRFGNLSVANQNFIESLLVGGKVGIFEGSTEIDVGEIEVVFDSINGLEVMFTPGPTLDPAVFYTLRFTQARPGDSEREIRERIPFTHGFELLFLDNDMGLGISPRWTEGVFQGEAVIGVRPLDAQVGFFGSLEAGDHIQIRNNDNTYRNTFVLSANVLPAGIEGHYANVKGVWEEPADFDNNTRYLLNFSRSPEDYVTRDEFDDKLEDDLENVAENISVENRQTFQVRAGLPIEIPDGSISGDINAVRFDIENFPGDYEVGQVLSFTLDFGGGSNTGNVTIEVNSLGTLSLLQHNGSQIPPGMLEDGVPVIATFTDIDFAFRTDIIPDVIDRRATAPGDVSLLPDDFRAIHDSGKVSGLFFRSDEDNPYFRITPQILGTGLLGYSEISYPDLNRVGGRDADAGFEAFYESFVSGDNERRWWVRYGLDVDGISEERTFANPSYSMFDTVATGIDATLEFIAANVVDTGVTTFIAAGNFVAGSDNILNFETSAVTIALLSWQPSTRQFRMIRSGGTATVNTMETYWGTGAANDQNWYSKSVFIRFADGTVAEIGRDARSGFVGGVDSASWTIRARETRLIEKLNGIAAGDTIVAVVADRRSIDWGAVRLLEGNILLKFEDSDTPLQMKPVNNSPYEVEWATDVITATESALTAGTAFNAALYDDEGDSLYIAADKRTIDIGLVLEKNAYPKYVHFYHEGANESGEDFTPADLYPDDLDVAESRRNLFKNRKFILGRVYSSTNDGLPLGEIDLRTGARGNVDVHTGETADGDLLRRTVVRPPAGTIRFYANIDLLTKEANGTVFLRLVQIKTAGDRVIDVVAEGAVHAQADDDYLFPDDPGEPVGGAVLLSTPIECDGQTDFALVWGVAIDEGDLRTDWKCANMRWGFEILGR